jgi:hypothetical protein
VPPIIRHAGDQTHRSASSTLAALHAGRTWVIKGDSRRLTQIPPSAPYGQPRRRRRKQSSPPPFSLPTTNRRVLRVRDLVGRASFAPLTLSPSFPTHPPPYQHPKPVLIAAMKGSKILSQLAPLVRDMATGGARGKDRKVAVLGAAGGIGQSLSLLMKVGGSDNPPQRQPSSPGTPDLGSQRRQPRPTDTFTLSKTSNLVVHALGCSQGGGAARSKGGCAQPPFPHLARCRSRCSRCTSIAAEAAAISWLTLPLSQDSTSSAAVDRGPAATASIWAYFDADADLPPSPPPRPTLSQMNPAVGQLSLYDVANVKGVAADISHVNTKAKVGVSFRGAPAGKPTPTSMHPASCRSSSSALAPPS